MDFVVFCWNRCTQFYNKLTWTDAGLMLSVFWRRQRLCVFWLGLFYKAESVSLLVRNKIKQSWSPETICLLLTCIYLKRSLDHYRHDNTTHWTGTKNPLVNLSAPPLEEYSRHDNRMLSWPMWGGKHPRGEEQWVCLWQTADCTLVSN